MSSPGGMSQGCGQWPAQQQQGPPLPSSNGGNEDGVSVRPMRLKVLYTFDDQNKTNCLARGEDVLQIKTVALDETTSIGILDLTTCIETVIRGSPELLTRVGQDYTIYAYDFSEYDNPLVGQGMLSRILAAASPNLDSPAQQSQKLLTGRVCKNILGLFDNGVKETLEVKLRFVPVPTAMQGEYVNTMEKYRETSSNIPTNMDHNEWTKFLQSNPSMAHMATKFRAPASITSAHRGSINMEVVNQLLSPSFQQQQASQDPFSQMLNVDSGNESRGGRNGGRAKKTSRPSSRAAVKRPRAKRQPKAAANASGNTSGYEEGTDGDDGPAPRKRAKITQTNWNNKSSFGTATDSLRVNASTAASLRMFRPIAMSPAPGAAASHLQEIPRAPTPVANFPNQRNTRDRQLVHSALRRDSTASQAEAPRKHVSPYPPLGTPEDLVRKSIESVSASPDRNSSPAETPSDIGSSPPMMRTASVLRSSPSARNRSPSQDLPEPRMESGSEQIMDVENIPGQSLPQPTIDSGFISGTTESDLMTRHYTMADFDDLFGEDGLEPYVEEEDDDFRDGPLPPFSKRTKLCDRKAFEEACEEIQRELRIEEQNPGPREFLPTRMPVCELPQPKATRISTTSRSGSLVSEDGQTTLLVKSGGRPSTRQPTPVSSSLDIQMSQSTTSQGPGSETSKVVGAVPAPPVPQPAAPTATADQPLSAPSDSQPRRGPMVRTASIGSLSLPAISASGPVLPPSSLQRSQTWTEAPHPAIDTPIGMEMSAPMPLQMPQYIPENMNAIPYTRAPISKKDSIRQKLELAIAMGEMPPYCSNCGAIETPTWRKAWSQEHTGKPGYYDYSDAPGRVTTIVIRERDSEGHPTKYSLIKKYLGPGEDHNAWQEFLLCNPCGIWMSKYKAHRPEEKWECNKGAAPKPPGKRPTQRASRAKKNQSIGNTNLTSEANFPQSDIFYPPSEAYYPQPEAAGSMEGAFPTDATGTSLQYNLQVQRVELPTNEPQPVRPVKRLNAMTSDAASAALRRAIQSSPARWVGTQNSPIDVGDEVGSTRRLLFPSPRKDGLPKVLGEVQSNIVHIAPEPKSPKGQTTEASNKENCPREKSADDEDAEFLALFEAELARPQTPVQKSQEPNAFKTPSRPTPNHRPITRSVSKSIRSARSAKSPGQLLMFGQQTPSKTPSSVARRRSPRNHHTVFESPFTATINQLMSEANDHLSPSQQRDMDYDFSNLPDLPVMDHPTHHNEDADVNWNLNDFFSTDVPMPSSPPRMFHLYEAPAAIANVDWSQFSHFADHPFNDNPDHGNKEVEIKEEPSEEQDALREKAAEQVTGLSAVQAVKQPAKSPKEKSTQELTEEPAEKPRVDPAEVDKVDMVGVGRTT